VPQHIAEHFCRLFYSFYLNLAKKIRLYRQISGGFFNENITNPPENPKNMNAVAWIVCAKCHAPAREYTRIGNNPFFIIHVSRGQFTFCPRISTNPHESFQFNSQ
jgi:hypothetical protein